MPVLFVSYSECRLPKHVHFMKIHSTGYLGHETFLSIYRQQRQQQHFFKLLYIILTATCSARAASLVFPGMTLRPRKVQELIQRHTARKWRCWGCSRDPAGSKVGAHPTPTPDSKQEGEPSGSPSPQLPLATLAHHQPKLDGRVCGWEREGRMVAKINKHNSILKEASRPFGEAERAQ